jgi:hypothetical protein
MAVYIIRKDSRTLTTSGSGYSWAPRTLSAPLKVDLATATDLAEEFGGVVEEEA